jgi:hypothetical protein
VLQYCPYTYVDNTPIECTPLPCPGILDPYFHIAEQYGFANWMFQTHQGPARRRIYSSSSGTSAPDYFNDRSSNCGSPDSDCWHWFAAENPKASATGCAAAAGTVVWELPPASSANYLLLLSRMEYRTSVVFLMQDDSTRRVYRLYDFTKSQTITSDHSYCVSGKVNSATNSTWLSSRSGGTLNTARIRSYASS